MGIDEAGRGPLAGPLVVAGVVWRSMPDPFVIDDSKRLTARQRQKAFTVVQNHAHVMVQTVSVREIERRNIYQATVDGARAVMQQCPAVPDTVLIDGLHCPDAPYPCRRVIKGDARSLTVAAASVIAKVTRDALMEEYARTYPQYAFHTNRGYGTREHMAALRQYGYLEIHRRTYNPLKGWLADGTIAPYRTGQTVQAAG